MTEAPLEDWYGLNVDADSAVTGLKLAANALSGAIPAELGELTRLAIVDPSGLLVDPVGGQNGSTAAATNATTNAARARSRITLTLSGGTR